METNTSRMTDFRFLPLDFFRFLELAFSSMKMRALVLETILFPVSFPLVSRFSAVDVSMETSVTPAR
jgi:hypothetical protein